MDRERTFTYIGIAAIVLLLFGLAGWYLFIQRQTESVESTSEARGFSIGIPSYLGSRGSTAANTSGDSTGGSGELGLGGAFQSFLGTGEGARTGTPSDPQTGEQTPGEPAPEARRTPRIWHVNSTPVAGASFIPGTSTRLRYVERATGHVFEATPSDGNVRRLTNTLVPKIYEASVGSNLIIERMFGGANVTTLVSRISTTTQDGVSRLESRDLGADVTATAALPGAPDVLFLTPAQGAIHLLRTAWNSTATRLVLSIPTGDFSILWPASSRIYLLEKPASGVVGSLFSAGTSLVPAIRNVPGLSAAVHPVQEAYLYTSDTGTALSFFIKLPAAPAVEMPVPTIADKCVWSPVGLTAYCAVPKMDPGARFTDRWYRGEAHTDDAWFTIAAGSASVEKFFTHDSDAAIDVENIRIDPTGQYLAFTNARDKSLWMLRIAE